MRPPIVVVLGLSWSLVCISCTCAGDESAAVPATGAMPSLIDRTPAPIPEGWIGEVEVGGDATLAAIGAQIPEDERLALPTRIGDLLDALVALPTAMVDRVDGGAPLRCVTLPLGDHGQEPVCAVRIDGLPPGTDLAPGAPRGAAWIVTGSGALAVADHVLVAADERALVERALPYLAPRMLAEEEVERAARARLAPQVAADALRTIADSAIQSSARDARERIASERAAHDAPPALGEPEALVAALASWASGMAAYVADLGAIELTLAPTATGLALRVRGEVREGSRLAQALASVPAADTLGLDVIPASAVIAWSTRSGTDARATLVGDLVGPLAEIAGPRLDVEGRAAIESAVGEWASARGATSIGAIGASPRASYAFFATDCARPLEPGRIAPALATAWSRTVLAAPLGCPDGQACAALEVAEREGACALVVRGGAAGQEASEERGTMAGDALARTSPLVAAPEVARELADAPPDALARVIVLPERVPGLLARLLRGSPETADAGAMGPLVLSIARDDGALVIDLRGPSEAIGALVRVIAPS